MEKNVELPYTIVKKEKQPKSLFVLEVEINESEVNKERTSVIKKLAETTEMDGFRKGKVPESVIIGKVGEMAIWQEASESVLEKIVPLIIGAEKLFFVARPKIEISKMAPGNPLQFKMSVPVMPEFELPDYKKIAKKTLEKAEKDPTVEDKEVDEALEQIKKMMVGDKKDATPPEITDETVKLFGPFKDLKKEFREKIKKDILDDKKTRQIEKRRLSLSDAIAKETKMEMPEALIDEEVLKIEDRFGFDIERMGMKIEDYLVKIKKTIEELRKEWRPIAEKRTAYDIIAGKIAATEKIIPTKEEIEKETDHVLEHHKDAKRENARSYVEHMMVHRKVFEFLENQK